MQDNIFVDLDIYVFIRDNVHKGCITISSSMELTWYRVSEPWTCVTWKYVKHKIRGPWNASIFLLYRNVDILSFTIFRTDKVITLLKQFLHSIVLYKFPIGDHMDHTYMLEFLCLSVGLKMTSQNPDNLAKIMIVKNRYYLMRCFFLFWLYGVNSSPWHQRPGTCQHQHASAC